MCAKRFKFGAWFICLCLLPILLASCGIGGSQSLGGKFEDLYRERVSLRTNEKGCQLLVSPDSESTWIICEVGSDFVKFCKIDGDSSLIYPITGLCLMEQ